MLEAVVSLHLVVTMARPVAMTGFVMVGPAGPLATITREPGQARKGAATAGTSCAGVWLVGFTSNYFSLFSMISFCMPVLQRASLLTCISGSSYIRGLIDTGLASLCVVSLSWWVFWTPL